MKIRNDELLGALPPEWPEDLLPDIRAGVAASGAKIVVIDDDPTGTQTVYDVPVLTEWSVESLAGVFGEPEALVYVLTNSRSVPLPQAEAINREIGTNLRAARRATGRDFVLASRSDSTLRGHYPGEVEALMAGIGVPFAGTLIVPFFLEGGRLTIDDTHYVAEGEWLVPAAETEYARDASFGYRHSNLREWVAEKYGGRIEPRDVRSISLETLRGGGPEAVATLLKASANGQVWVINAAGYRDVEVLVAGLLRAEAAGRRFLYRTAASFVRVRGALARRPLLTGADLAVSREEGGGLIVAGSYIQKSTEQIQAALALPGVNGLEVSVEQILDGECREVEVRRVADAAKELLAAGKDTLIYTSRRLVSGSGETGFLGVGQQVSAALVEIVRCVSQRPRWLIAKGGITSSDVATKGLGVRRAQVVGQAIPGVPIWRLGQESWWPDLTYVVFPGNVGGPGAIAEMIQILRGEGNAG